MGEKYSIGFWDVETQIDLSERNLIQACETDAPTCAMVFKVGPYGSDQSADPHHNENCSLCYLIEQYAEKEIEFTETESYTDYNGVME